MTAGEEDLPERQRSNRRTDSKTGICNIRLSKYRPVISGDFRSLDNFSNLSCLKVLNNNVKCKNRPGGKLSVSHSGPP